MEKPIIFKKSPIKMKMLPGTYYWCACGKSKNQPFCDGSHQGGIFSPIKVEINEEKEVYWCSCKHSKTKPWCDGTHRDL
jgi:CDGSH iron-sulfur domain-containing protein 3